MNPHSNRNYFLAQQAKKLREELLGELPEIMSPLLEDKLAHAQQPRGLKSQVPPPENKLYL